MLEDAGFQVALDNTKDTSATTALYVRDQFQTIITGINFGNDDTAGYNMASTFLSTSTNNHSGLKDPELDSDIRAIFAAGTDAEKTAAYGKAETELNNDAIMVPLAVTEEFIAWQSNVHGVRTDTKSNVLLDKAWLG